MDLLDRQIDSMIENSNICNSCGERMIFESEYYKDTGSIRVKCEGCNRRFMIQQNHRITKRNN